MTNLANQIAARLTEAQRDALVACDPHDVCVGAGIAIAFCVHGLLDADGDDWTAPIVLNPLGLAVRAELEKTNDK